MRTLVRTASVLVGMTVCALGGAVSAAPLPLWAEGAPGAKGTEPGDIPTITVYPAQVPAGGPKTAAIVVCPGGGYGGLAAHEAEPIAQWLNSIGVTGVVLRYRLGPKYHPRRKRSAAPGPLMPSAACHRQQSYP